MTPAQQLMYLGVEDEDVEDGLITFESEADAKEYLKNAAR